MPILDRSDPLFANVPESYTSPFPASTSPKFWALSGDGSACAAQALAWQNVTQMSMAKVAASTIAGGLRDAWMPALVQLDAGIAGDVVRGIFGRADFPSTTSAGELGIAAAQVGLEIALDALSAIPIAGNILRAAVSIGRAMYALFHDDDDIQQLTVPWQQFTRDSDEDFVNALIVQQIAPSVDWTVAFAPPLSTAVGWKLAKTDKGGDTRAFGPFTDAGGLVYTGMGYMPGTERIADIIQIAQAYKGSTSRKDIVTNVGDFYPSSGQFCTQAWQWATKLGGLAMYSVRAAEIDGPWHDFFASFFEDGFAQVKLYPSGSIDGLFAAKALLKMVGVKGKNGATYLGLPNELLAHAGNYEAFVSPEMFKRNPFSKTTKLVSPYDLFIKPALKRLRDRQLAALARTVVCAYVRPKPVGNLPAHAAFLDTGPAHDPKFASWGAQLTARCLELREVLLGHDARWEVSISDAKAADPAFAERLIASRTGTPPWKANLKAPTTKPLDPGTHEPQGAKPPQGGPPFDTSLRAGRSSSSGLWLGVGAGAAAVIGGVALARKLRG